MDGEPQLTRGQNLVLNAVLPILVIGVALPIGLVALLLWVDGGEASDAVSRGELFLAGGNAAFTACLILVAARPDKAVGVSIFSMIVVGGFVIPCYVAWAHIAASTAIDKDYSAGAALEGGEISAIAGLLLASLIVVYAFWRPPGTTTAS